MVEKQKPKFINFANRGGQWDDIVPVEQYEGGKAPICPIAYNQPIKDKIAISFYGFQEYEQIMGYFRAILIKNELSMRAYNLCAEVLSNNPGDYQAWQHRRACIDHLKIPTANELKFINSVGIALEKNFQIWLCDFFWHHRRCIMEIHQDDFEKEKDYLQEIFISDSKNYHAWSYRLWFVERFDLWDGEMGFVEYEMNDGEVTNNSLWSYRYFLVTKANKELTKEIVKNELQYAMEMLSKYSLSNEAAWVYLKGYLAQTREEQLKSQLSNVRKWLITDFLEVKEWCQGLLSDTEVNNKGNRFIYSLLIDFATAEGEIPKAIEYLALLKKIDRLRENYYQWRINNLSQTQ